MPGPRTGRPGAYQQPSQWGRNESGNYEVWSFEGTPQEIRNVAARFASVNGINYHVSQSYGKWRLDVNFPWNADGLVLASTDVVVKWELFTQNPGKYLLNAVDNAGMIAQLSTFQKQKIKNLIANPPDPQASPIAASDFVDSAHPNDGNSATAFIIWKYMQAGETEYLVEAPILRRTIITSNQWAPTYSMIGVRKLWSSATLYQAEAIPNALMFPITNLLSSDTSTDPNLVYAWYKHIPTVTNVALQKWQIIQEWTYGWWTQVYQLQGGGIL